MNEWYTRPHPNQCKHQLFNRHCVNAEHGKKVKNLSLSQCTCTWSLWFISVFTQMVPCARNPCLSPNTQKANTFGPGLAVGESANKHNISQINASHYRRKGKEPTAARFDPPTLGAESTSQNVNLYLQHGRLSPTTLSSPPPCPLIAHLFTFVTSLRWSRLLCLIQTALNL